MALTVRELSEASGVAENTIYRIETGEVKDAKVSSIKPLIKALNVTADEILFDPSEFTGLIGLKKALVRTAKLPYEDVKLIIKIINKLCLATEIEHQVSEVDDDYEAAYYEKQAKEDQAVEEFILRKDEEEERQLESYIDKLQN